MRDLFWSVDPHWKDVLWGHTCFDDLQRAVEAGEPIHGPGGWLSDFDSLYGDAYWRCLSAAFEERLYLSVGHPDGRVTTIGRDWMQETALLHLSPALRRFFNREKPVPAMHGAFRGEMLRVWCPDNPAPFPDVDGLLALAEQFKKR